MIDNLLLEEIPEKFKDPETGDVRFDSLVRSYKELERKLSHMGAQMPKPPKSYEDYCIECTHGMFESDTEINKRLYDKGFSQEQAQEVYDLAAEKMMPVLQDIMADIQADREVEKLINHFGGVETWKEISRQLLAFGQRNVAPDIFESLSGSYEGILSLYGMMKNDEPGLKNNAEVSVPGVSDTAELQSMMRDPKYWRDKDPAFVKKVTEGFQSVYGE